MKLETSYNPTTNTGILAIIGAPKTDEEVNTLIFETQKIIAHPNTLTYLITDLSNIELPSMDILTKFQLGIGPIIAKNVAYSIFVVQTTKSELVSRIFNISSGRHLPIVSSIPEAQRLVSDHQTKLGVFPPKK